MTLILATLAILSALACIVVYAALVAGAQAEHDTPAPVCPQCGGSGYVLTKHVTVRCPTCNGQGYTTI